MSFGFRAGDRDDDEDLMSRGPSTHGRMAGVSRSPSLARLLSVSAIVVALAVAGSLALEDVLRQEALTDTDDDVRLTENAPAQPEAADPMNPDGSHSDMVRVNYLERRLALLERQIVVLQTQLTAAQQDNVKFGARLAAIQTQLTSTAVPLERVVTAPSESETPDSENADQSPVATEKTTPIKKTMAKLESEPPKAEDEPVADRVMQRPRQVTRDETTVIPASDVPATETVAEALEVIDESELNGIDPIVTGSIDPASDAEAEDEPNDELSMLVKPEVRETTPREVSRTRFGLSFNLYKSITGVQAAWEKLKARHAALLSGLEPRAMPQGTQEGELKYRLVVGPIENAAGAAKRCAKLATRGIKCTPSVFSGEFVTPPPAPGTLLQTNSTPQPIVEDTVLSDALQSLIANPPVPRPKPGLKPRAQTQTRPAL